MKTLDMADKYDPLSYQDDEPTVKVDMNTILPKVFIEDDEPTLPSQPNPFMVKRSEEKRYPGIGLLICLVTGVLFWGSIAFFACR